MCKEARGVRLCLAPRAERERIRVHEEDPCVRLAVRRDQALPLTLPPAKGHKGPAGLWQRLIVASSINSGSYIGYMCMGRNVQPASQGHLTYACRP